MKNIFFSAILIAGLVPLISGCGNEDTSPGSHRNLPGTLTHCSKEWQLSVPSAHSSMSKHSASMHTYPSVQAGSQLHVGGAGVVVCVYEVVSGGVVVDVHVPSTRQIHS